MVLHRSQRMLSPFIIFISILLFRPYFNEGCPIGYFLSMPLICSKCPDNCLSCTSQNQCSYCEPLFYLNVNNQKCEYCPEGCLFCDSTQCLSCQDNYYLNNTICYHCAFGCDRCSGSSSSECLSCVHGFQYDENKKICTLLLEKTVCNITGCDICDNEGRCIACQNGYYFDSNNTSCSLCDKHCRRCSGPEKNQCTQCKEGGILSKDNQCQYNCTHPACKSCYGISINECEECSALYDLSDGYCIMSQCLASCQDCTYQASVFDILLCKSCIDGFFFSSNTCKACQPNCSRCSSESFCFSCKKNYYLLNSRCLECQKGCQICENADACIDCKEMFYLNNNNSCSACNDSCKSCFGSSSNQCLSCNIGKKLNGTKCIDLYPKIYEDTLIDLAMKLIIALACSIFGLACIVTVIYRAFKRDHFFDLVSKTALKYKGLPIDSDSLEPIPISEKKEVEYPKPKNIGLNEEKNENKKKTAENEMIILKKIAQKKSSEEEEAKESVESEKKYELEIINESVASEEKESALVV